MTVADANEIIDDIKALKYKLVKAQDFNNSAIMRDMERDYLNKEIKENLEKL